MSTYHLPGKGIPAVLRKAAGLPQLGGSKAKAMRSLKDVVGLAQVAVKVYRDMLRTPDEPPAPEPAEPPPTEAGRLRQSSGTVWLALGLVGRDLVTDTGGETAEGPSEEELWRAVLEEGRSIIEKLDRIIQTLQRWLNLFALFLSRFFFFEFPNNLRHLCTTMPWSIWPALVVLWGVCWMFYSEGAEGRRESRDLEVPQQFSPLPGYPQPSVSPLDLGVITPAAPMPRDTYLWDGFSTYEAPMVDWAPVPATLSPTDYQPNGQAFTGLWPVTSPLDTAVFSTTPVGGKSVALGPFPVASSNELMVAPKEMQTSGHSTSMVLGTPPTSPGVPTGHGNPVSAEDPGKSHQRPLASHAKRRRARHECDTCSKKFGSTTDLRRHRKTVHKEGRATDLFCTWPACKRTQGAFSRKDNLKKHMETVHGLKGDSARSPSVPVAEGSGKQEVEGGRAGPGGEEALRQENERLREEVAALRRELEAAGKREAHMWKVINRQEPSQEK